MLNLSIVIPVFNEKDNIKNLLMEIFNAGIKQKFEIILVNDGSTDESINVINLLKENYDNIILINNSSNFGQSYSIHSGINKAKYNSIVTLDADGQNDPKDINTLIEIYENNTHYKLVGGLRVKRKDSLTKRFSSLIANSIRKKLLKDGCNDTGCSLKIFDRDIFLNFPYFDGIHRFLPALFSGYGHKTYFIKVNHRTRMSGKSKYGTFNRLIKGIKGIIKVKKILKQNDSKFYK